MGSGKLLVAGGAGTMVVVVAVLHCDGGTTLLL